MALYEKFYYNGTIRKLTVAFGSLFSNIFVSRRTSGGAEIEREIVPITYSNKEKFVQRLMGDPDSENKSAIKLPHLAFEITNYSYDPERKLSSKRKVAGTPSDEQSKFKFFYTPVPYNLEFSLYLVTKTQEEGLQIVEQILPFFTPDYVLTVKLSDIDEYKQDVPISLTSVSNEDSYEGDFDKRRTIIWTLQFRMKAYLLGPQRNSGKILHTVVKSYVGDQVISQPSAPVVVDGALPTTNTFQIIEGIEGSVFDLTTQTNEGKSLVLDVPRGTDFSFVVEVANEVNVLIPLDGYNTFAKFRKSFSHPAVYSMTTQLGADIGTIICTIPASTTANLELGYYLFDVHIENQTTMAYNRVMEGFINLKR